MNKEEKEILINNYLLQTCDEAEKQIVEKLLQEDEEARMIFKQTELLLQKLESEPTLQPSESLRQTFLLSLANELKPTQKTKAFSINVFYKVAAALLVVATSVAAGFWVNTLVQQRKEYAALQKEMQETKALLLSMMKNPMSASQRMVGVSQAADYSSLDEDIIKSMFRLLNEDPNSNVRLAALEALAKYNTKEIKEQLLISLENQKDPVVQVELIKLLTQDNTQAIKPTLEELIQKEGTEKVVRDAAHSALLRLS
ncbi:MAG: HEAT repeat domain-containing protein [Cyclobacteriaceae bacterium]|jgi:hypothetical protein|nr:HEAT repeat domain-containing protein [Cyclobacteriaceae bacterium]